MVQKDFTRGSKNGAKGIAELPSDKVVDREKGRARFGRQALV
jgi:hypothetical protein